jgi:solute carrier family 35 protein E1
MEKFPDIDTAVAPLVTDGVIVGSPIKQASVSAHPLLSQDRWRPAVMRDGSLSPGGARGSYSPSPSRSAGRARTKSISDAFRTIRTRQGSISQNAQELAGALRVPLSPTLVVGTPPSPVPFPPTSGLER